MAQIDRPLLPIEHPNRWFECEKAIGPRFNAIVKNDLSAEAIYRLVRDAVAVGWTDYEVQRAMWSLKWSQDEVEPGTDSKAKF